MTDQFNTSGAVFAWIHYARPRPHWYLVDEARKKALKASWSDVEANARETGASKQGTFHIRGQHDFETVAFWTFPSSQVAYDFWQALVEANYTKFFAFSNNIGLELREGSDA